jgi:hypothetical protein
VQARALAIYASTFFLLDHSDAALAQKLRSLFSAKAASGWDDEPSPHTELLAAIPSCNLRSRMTKLLKRTV